MFLLKITIKCRLNLFNFSLSNNGKAFFDGIFIKNKYIYKIVMLFILALILYCYFKFLSHAIVKYIYFSNIQNVLF